MRNAMKTLIACVPFIALALFAHSAFAVPSHTLKGRFSVSTVELDCVNASGTFFNTPHGGYGCATGQGTVTCTNKGKCQGTCTNCAARRLSKGGIKGILHGGNAGAKATRGSNPPKSRRHPVNVGTFKNKNSYRRSTGPTNPNGPDIPGKNKGPFTNPEHHFGGGRHH